MGLILDVLRIFNSLKQRTEKIENQLERKDQIWREPRFEDCNRLFRCLFVVRIPKNVTHFQSGHEEI